MHVRLDEKNVSSSSNHQITFPQTPHSLSFKTSYFGFVFLRVYVVGPWHCFVFVLGFGVTGCVAKIDKGLKRWLPCQSPARFDKLATLSTPREIDKVAASSMPRDVTD